MANSGHSTSGRFHSGSVTHWLDGVQRGDSQAAQELWNRYFARLTAVAEARLATMRQEASGEDIALSALKSVMIGVRNNRYPELRDRDSLWPLLVTITARKAVSQQRRQLARKRSRTAECRWEDVRDYVGVEPTPMFAIEIADELDCLIRSLADPALRQIVELKLAGCSNKEISEELSCSVRTVIRKLELIRREWRDLADPTDDGIAEP